MKTYHVYELVNSQGAVEYVGRTTRPVGRMYQHTKTKPIVSSGHGKFYGRTDLMMNIVKTFTNSKDASRHEGELKLSHGLQWTERENNIRNGQIGGKVPNYTLRKLDYEKAQYIRAQYARKFDVFGKTITQARLAKVFAVDKKAIQKILHNKTYNTP